MDRTDDAPITEAVPPYLNTSCVFDLTSTRSILPEYDALFPCITLDYLHKNSVSEKAGTGKKWLLTYLIH